jgi:hypothetical protein
MGYGVKPELNAKQPSDFPNGHPLNIEADYWSGWGSYIFMLMDGKADPDGDGVKNVSFSYHCGSDPAYLTFSIEEHIHVAADHEGIQMEFDLLKLLTNEDGSRYDIESNPATSNNVGDVRVALEIMSHYASAVSIKQ